MNRINLSLIVFMIFSNLAYANWGGFNYGSVATGDFRPVGTNKVKILNENLNIDLYQGRALVTVTYELKNTGSAVEIKAGFPCITDYNTEYSGGADRKQEGYKEISNYSIAADGITLSYQESSPETVHWLTIPLDPSNFSYEFENGNSNDDENAKVFRSLKVLWLFSKLKFKPNEKHEVVIAYASDYLVDGGGGGDSSMGGESDVFDARYFRYLLSTGNVWNGPIQKGKIVIRALSVDPDQVSIKPAGRFMRDENVFSWKFRNLKPNVPDNIEVCLNDNFSVFFPIRNHDRFAYYENPTRYYRDINDCDVFASSIRSSEYPAKNLLDGDGQTAWVAGGNNSGIGESVTFVFDKPVKITEIGIASGYLKSERLYFANNRPSTIQISIDDQSPMVKSLSDEYASCCDNEDRDYRWLPLNEVAKPVHQIVLKILGVYRGKSYDDTCISDILFRDRLKEDPHPMNNESLQKTPADNSTPVAKPMKR